MTVTFIELLVSKKNFFGTIYKKRKQEKQEIKKESMQRILKKKDFRRIFCKNFPFAKRIYFKKIKKGLAGKRHLAQINDNQNQRTGVYRRTNPQKGPGR